MTPGKSVLLVDDCQDQSFLIERAFRRSNAGIVYPLSSGEAALEHLAQCAGSRPTPDLVLLDRDMPGGMDGFETLRTIRSLAHLERMPVVMITGSDEHEDEARAAGADGYEVKKPDRNGFDGFTQKLILWQPEQSWRATKEIVRVSCGRGVDDLQAVAASPVPSECIDIPQSRMEALPNSREALHLTMAALKAQAPLSLLLRSRSGDQILAAKRKRFVVELMLLGWSNSELGLYLEVGTRYLEERRSEWKVEAGKACGSRAVLLK